jgi:hypothetical protein
MHTIVVVMLQVDIQVLLHLGHRLKLFIVLLMKNVGLTDLFKNDIYFYVCELMRIRMSIK